MRIAIRIVSGLIVAAMVMPVSAVAAPLKRVRQDGSVPGEWDLPKPAAEPHEDEAPEAAGGDGTGSNSMSFASYDSGDMIVALGTPTGHAGEWDDSYYTTLYGKCVWSANTTPVDGVQLEAPIKYRGYDRAYGLWVPSVPYTKRLAARTYCRLQRGEPYRILSSKTDQSHWYCSKLVWASYRYTSYVDLDADGGYWVWPIDLVNDSQTSVFAYAA